MKKYLEDSDLFIDFRYVPNVPNAKDGEECEHKGVVNGVELFHAIQGEFQTTYIKVYLTEKQIISAYENIQKIESEKIDLVYEANLPF